MRKSNPKELKKSYEQLMIEGKIKTVKLWIKRVISLEDRCRHEGDLEVINQVDELLSTYGQVTDTVISNTFQMGKQHYKHCSGVKIELPKHLPVTASARAMLAAYLTGLAFEATEELDQLELELARLGVLADDGRESRLILAHQAAIGARSSAGDPKPKGDGELTSAKA